MDQLYKRYADPFSFVNGMIQTGRFCEFVESFVDTLNEEKEEEHTWNFFLHKVFEGSYRDFKNSIETDKQNQEMSDDDIEAALQHTMQIMNNFNPEQGGE